MTRRRTGDEVLLAKVFKTAVKSGELLAGTSVRHRPVLVVPHGTAVQTGRDKTVAELRRVAERTREAWPKKS